jgi:hypothetical protein
MDPLSAIGLWTVSLVGISAIVYVARGETRRHRELGLDHEGEGALHE